MSKNLFIVWTLGISCCSAQSDRAALTGTISDASRAGIPSAHVKLIYPDTGLSRETVSSSAGVFRLSGLPISRKATDTPDGNTNQQRPDVVAGVSLVPEVGQSTTTGPTSRHSRLRRKGHGAMPGRISLGDPSCFRWTRR